MLLNIETTPPPDDQEIEAVIMLHAKIENNQIWVTLHDFEPLGWFIPEGPKPAPR